MKARKGRLRDKCMYHDGIGRWLSRYILKRTCRNWKRRQRPAVAMYKPGGVEVTIGGHDMAGGTYTQTYDARGVCRKCVKVANTEAREA